MCVKVQPAIMRSLGYGVRKYPWCSNYNNPSAGHQMLDFLLLAFKNFDLIQSYYSCPQMTSVLSGAIEQENPCSSASASFLPQSLLDLSRSCSKQTFKLVKDAKITTYFDVISWPLCFILGWGWNSWREWNSWCHGEDTSTSQHHSPHWDLTPNPDCVCSSRDLVVCLAREVAPVLLELL